MIGYVGFGEYDRIEGACLCNKGNEFCNLLIYDRIIATKLYIKKK